MPVVKLGSRATFMMIAVRSPAYAGSGRSAEYVPPLTTAARTETGLGAHGITRDTASVSTASTSGDSAQSAEDGMDAALVGGGGGIQRPRLWPVLRERSISPPCLPLPAPTLLAPPIPDSPMNLK